MIVVAIIGMLAAVAIPSLMKARGNSARTACFSNQLQIRAHTLSWKFEKRKGKNDVPTEDQLKGYFDTGKFPQCPGGGTYEVAGVTKERDVYPSCSEHGCYVDEEDGKPDDEED